MTLRAEEFMNKSTTPPDSGARRCACSLPIQRTDVSARGVAPWFWAAHGGFFTGSEPIELGVLRTCDFTQNDVVNCSGRTRREALVALMRSITSTVMRALNIVYQHESMGRMIMLAAHWDSAPYLGINPRLPGRESLITPLEHSVN